MYLNDEEKSSPQAEKLRKRSHLIPEAEIERLKREVDLLALVRSYGVVLKAVGQDFLGKRLAKNNFTFWVATDEMTKCNSTSEKWHV